ncbi:MAG: septal ring lytic transglycosylase RlpA family protein [Candidatus Cloacimonadota bacterium]|nr:septal ring lytic transglycosylase RlpA family protein [Candidatus Cloacimonadota bacterium]
MKYLLLIFLISCSVDPKFYTNPTVKYPKLKKEIKAEDGYFVTSFYGKKFDGKLTANGETFDMKKMTCAHKSLPFNTRIKLTDPDSGIQIEVRVNDRGPFVKGRDLDISRRAAEKIGLVPYGFKKLKYKIIK